jgi:hypothetical protein
MKLASLSVFGGFFQPVKPLRSSNVSRVLTFISVSGHNWILFDLEINFC